MADASTPRRTTKKVHKRTPAKPIIDVDVDITPSIPCGPAVICDLAATPGGSGGDHVIGGVIFLNSSEDYRLHLHLVSGALGQFSWDADPFWSKKSKCPTKAGITPVGQFPSPPAANGYALDVAVNGVPGKSAIHFRLNMVDSNGNPVFCDPIIINN